METEAHLQVIHEVVYSRNDHVAVGHVQESDDELHGHPKSCSAGLERCRLKDRSSKPNVVCGSTYQLCIAFELVCSTNDCPVAAATHLTTDLCSAKQYNSLATASTDFHAVNGAVCYVTPFNFE
jgi:hypothetical protein